MNVDPLVCAAGGAVLHCGFDGGLCDWMLDADGDLRWEIGTAPAGMIVTSRGQQSALSPLTVAVTAQSKNKCTHKCRLTKKTKQILPQR